jgi:aspartyl protease family protein
MTNDLMLGSVYIIMAVGLMVAALMSRREPAARLFKMAAAWIVIFAAGFVLFTFRDDFGYLFQRLRAEAVGTPVNKGVETRVPMALDGHFWVDARLNGHDVRFLVDSGATMTTIDRQTANSSGVAVSGKPDELVRTGNGVIKVSSGRAGELNVGSIERRNVGLQIVEKEDLNVLGMNYLSTLKRWGVEGRWLVLVG